MDGNRKFIDISTRKMVYVPWLLDENLNYKQPSKNAIKEVYGINGQTIIETYSKFLIEGGDSDSLLSDLNSALSEFGLRISNDDLFDSLRWYTNEFYFYFIMLVKKNIGNFEWYYSDLADNTLCLNHKIYEAGVLRFSPFGKDCKNINNSLFCIILENLKNKGYQYQDIIDWLDILVSEYTELSYKSDILKLDDLWVSSELFFFFIEFVKVVTNSNNINSIIKEIDFNMFISIDTEPEKELKSILGLYFNNNFQLNITNQKKVIHTEILFDDENFVCNKLKYYKNYTYIIAQIVAGIHSGIYSRKRNQSRIKSYNLIFQDKSYDIIIDKKSKRFSYMIPLIFSLITAILFITLPKNYWFDFSLFSSTLFIWIVNLLFDKYKQQSRNYSNLKEDVLRLKEKLYYESKENFIKSESEFKKRESQYNIIKNKTDELRKQNYELNEFEKIKSKFYDNVLHELKTPLTLISSPINSIISNQFGDSIDVKNSIFNIIQKNCNRLKVLINMLLNSSKIDNGKMKLKCQETNMVNFCEEQLLLFKHQYESKNVKYTLKTNENLQLISSIDQILFEIVITNILSNAYKFSNDDCEIDIFVNSSYCSQFIEISIKDNGIGIPSDKIEKIFDRFHQIETDSVSPHEGTGLGLSLVKEIVEMHDGQIVVESELGSGSTFTIIIPIIEKRNCDLSKPESLTILKPSNLPINNPTINIANISKDIKNILLVEDNSDLAEYIVSILKEDYQFIYANNGFEALEIIDNEQKIDLIISDIMMPKMDGLTLLNRLFQKGLVSTIPFIFLSAKSNEEDLIKGFNLGAIDYITKPFNFDLLKTKIERIFEYNNSRDNATVAKIKENFNFKLESAFSTSYRDETDSRSDLFEKFNITKREQEIINLVFRGMQDKEIAYELNIVTTTVSKHLANIYGKLNISNRLELTTFFMKKSLVYS